MIDFTPLTCTQKASLNYLQHIENDFEMVRIHFVIYKFTLKINFNYSKPIKH